MTNNTTSASRPVFPNEIKNIFIDTGARTINANVPVDQNGALQGTPPLSTGAT